MWWTGLDSFSSFLNTGFVKYAKTRLRSFPALLGVCFFALTTAAEDWPQFLGPHRNSVSAETGLVEKFPANGLPLIWEKEIGTGYCAPSIRDSKLFLFHRVANEEIVECLDAATGKPVWRYSYPSKFQDPYGYNNGPRSAPLLTTNHCYTFGAEGMLSCVDLKNGKLVWQYDTAKKWDVPEAFFGVGSSPVLENDMLLMMVGGQPNAGMVAFRANTGDVIWESVGRKNWDGLTKLAWPGEPKIEWRDYEKQASYATPVIATVHGRRVAFCLMRQGLVALNPRTGEVYDSFWFRARVEESVNASDPIVVENRVFISSAYYKSGSVWLSVEPSMKFKEVRRDLVLELHWMTPVLHQGYLYAFSGRNEPDARFRCVEFKTGKLMWDRDERWAPHSSPQPKVFGRGSCLLADNKLFVLGEGGLLGLFKVNPKEPEEISRWQVPQLQYPCWAAPILSNKRLYLRNEKRLVCLNASR